MIGSGRANLEAESVGFFKEMADLDFALFISQAR